MQQSTTTPPNAILSLRKKSYQQIVVKFCKGNRLSKRNRLDFVNHRPYNNRGSAPRFYFVHAKKVKTTKQIETIMLEHKSYHVLQVLFGVNINVGADSTCM